MVKTKNIYVYVLLYVKRVDVDFFWHVCRFPVFSLTLDFIMCTQEVMSVKLLFCFCLASATVAAVPAADVIHC